MPSAAEDCREPSAKCQGISHCLESGHPVFGWICRRPELRLLPLYTTSVLSVLYVMETLTVACVALCSV